LNIASPCWTAGAAPPVELNEMCLSDTALHGKPVSELWSVTCHIGLHQTQVNLLCLNPSQTGWPVLNLLAAEGWKATHRKEGLAVLCGCATF